jgi:hypothetical protein
MAYIPLQIPPGVYKNGTEYQSKGRWTDANLVRWYENTIRPVGGWRKRSNNQLTGSARGLINWRDSNNNRRIGIGTHSKLYSMNESGTLTDITPTSFTVGDADAVLKIGCARTGTTSTCFKCWRATKPRTLSRGSFGTSSVSTHCAASLSCTCKLFLSCYLLTPLLQLSLAHWHWFWWSVLSPHET